VKNVQTTATIISIVFIIIFWIIIIGSDVLDYFKIGNQHIDMDEWRREKFRGEKVKPKKTKIVKKNDKYHQ
jgi:amino acid transporter